ncbi:hypothetical protein ACFQO4_11105 [Saliphagus sp. GCM10025334]|uniref:hypothetical protein n=1 Tax=Natronosalvus halobius TaxID=2953746 RepID=UPI00209F4616|nr:hypothetical protein [Natronosalvus halobius]USZ70746.1 hypothetical protein NGM15_11610 [Natronosalvus halobius]
MATDCTYCGSDVECHDPVFVSEATDDGRERAGQFCNYACLAAYIDEQALTVGAACEWP